MDNIKVVMLNNGDFAIGQMVDDNLTKPMVIHLNGNADGSIALAFMPVGTPICSDVDDVIIPITAIMCYLPIDKVDPNIITKYTTHTSGIHIPHQNGIIS